MVIVSVTSVTATLRADVYCLAIVIEDDGLSYPCQYVSEPDDPYGINPTLRNWLATNSYDLIPFSEVK